MQIYKIKMDLREALKNNKKLTHNSPLRRELYEKLKNLNFNSYQEAVYIFLNELDDIPKCPFSSENQYFNGIEYVGVSKNYFNYIKHDKNLNARWLSWNHLFNIGLTLLEAKKLKEEKDLQYVRLKFSFNSYNKKMFKEVLINDGFLENKIKEILQFDYYNKIELINFIKNIKKIYSTKNNTLQYYLNRGYDLNQSEKLLKDFFNTWEKFNKSVHKDSERYKKWKESRTIGLNKTRGSKRSKFEKKIYEELKDKFDINLKFCTKIESPLFSKSKFKHDFLFNNQLIIEYNGTYWHKDLFTDKRFNDIELYKLELYRAKLSIKYNNLKYLILWEGDINNDINIVEKIISDSLNNNEKKFFSSRDIDYQLYDKLN